MTTESLGVLVMLKRPIYGKILRLGALGALLLLAPIPHRAEEISSGFPHFVTQRWTVADGLPVNALTDLAQTPDGWLWIGSFDGLLRFDGVRFTRFDTVRVPALRSNRILQLLVDNDGSLWILSEQGHLTRHRGGRFDAIDVELGETPFGMQMTLDGEGTLWLATKSGLYRAHEKRLVAGPEEFRGQQLSTVGTGGTGQVWLAIEHGPLAVLEKGVPRFVELGTEVNSSVKGFFEGQHGALWISTLSQGLFRWRQGEVEQIANVERVRQALREEPFLESRNGSRGFPFWMDEGLRRSVQRDPTRALWEAAGGVLYRSGREVLRLPQNSFRAMIFDREGTAWLATDSEGLFALRPNRVKALGEAEGLPHKNIYVLHEDLEGAIWIGGLGGLAKVEDGEVVTISSDLAFRPFIVYDDPGSGLLLVEGLQTFAALGDPGTRRIPLANVEPPELPLRGAFAILRTREDRLLLSNHDGVWESRRGDPAADGWRFRNIPGTEDWVVRVLAEDSEGAVWFGTNGHGVVRYFDGRLTRVTVAEGLASNLVRDLHLDAAGYLWVATEDRGLGRIDTKSLAPPTQIQKRHGLWDNALHKILEDDAGWLWISSNRGIFRVHRAELNDFAEGWVSRVDSVVYTEQDGMRNREANGGRQGAGIRTRSGEFWFATQDGVAIFDPEALVGDLPPPPVHVEGVWVGEREISVVEGVEVALAAEERSFRVEYTGLSLRASERMRFAYQLEGFDEDWQDAGSRRSAAYTRVPPGRYSFRVRARSSEGVWNETAVPMALEVLPYFYETWWFKLLAILAAGCLLLWILAWRDRHQRTRRRELEALVRERTVELENQKKTVTRQAQKLADLDRARADLFANISHELRTPLTLVLGPLGDLGEERFGSLSHEARREVDRMQANGARLVELVNQILDTAQLEASGLALHVVRADFARFATQVADRFVAVGERCGLDFAVEVPAAPVWLYFDREQLDKVLTNLLSNAFKFTPRGGQVLLRIEAPGENEVRLTVRDTGCGIGPSDLPHLFDRFYQGRCGSGALAPGMGLGLALAHDLVELHGGTLGAESTHGQGSIFTLTLRRGSDHFQDEQIVDGSSGSEPQRGTFHSPAHGAAEALLVDRERPLAPEEDTLPNEIDRTTVLVVDDHPDLRAYVGRHLEDRYRVIEAAHGAEGLEKARRFVPDLILSDVMMPLPASAPPDAPQDGFALFRAIKSDPELEFLPVILLTAKVSAESRLEGLAESADDFVAKPFDIRELRARVDNLIRLRQRLRQHLLGIAVPQSVPELSSVAADAEPTQELFLTRVLEVIDEQLADEDFNVETLARHLALSRSALYQRMEGLGQPPAGLILERRLRRGAELLRRDAGSVGEVAFGVGFKSVSHFTQRFRERFGKTPTAYRRRAA